MTGLRILVAGLGLGLLALIVWASMNSGPLHGSIFQQGSVILGLPWGLVTMADLYVGFIFFSIVMILAERSFIAGALWAAPILVLGNVWAAIWLIFRLPSLARRLTFPDREEV